MGRGEWGTVSLHTGNQGPLPRDSPTSRVFQKLL